MKCIIIYFTLTGNTGKVARQIHRGMSPLVEQCDLVPLEKADPGDLSRYDLIGLGSPVMWSPPENLRAFIETMPSLPGKHSFVFCTHGAMPEYYFPRMVRLLNRKGYIVIGTGDWFGSVCIPPFPKPYITDGHPDEIDLKEAGDFGREMVERSRRISAGETGLIPPVPEMPAGHRFPRIIPGGLKLNVEKCLYPKCRLCMDNCPWNAIDLTASPPVFARNCPICCFCEVICPAGAVEGDLDYAAEVHIPIIREHLGSSMDKAEAEGVFRRLVPREKVGWDTPFYRFASRHPRVKIARDE